MCVCFVLVYPHKLCLWRRMIITVHLNLTCGYSVLVPQVEFFEPFWDSGEPRVGERLALRLIRHCEPARLLLSQGCQGEKERERERDSEREREGIWFQTPFYQLCLKGNTSESNLIYEMKLWLNQVKTSTRSFFFLWDTTTDPSASYVWAGSAHLAQTLQREMRSSGPWR